MFAFILSDVRDDAGQFGISTNTVAGPGGILMNIVQYLLLIIGFLGVLAFIISGIMYLVSAGDEDTAKSAKQYMTYAIIGITVALLGFVVLDVISTLLGAGGA